MLTALLKPLHSKEKSLVLESINSLRFKVTPENIALSTSLPVATATQQLNMIAAETAAHLKVDSNGALLYEFAPGFERAYVYDITKQLFSVNGNFFFRAMRVLFRLALGLTMLTIKVALVVANFLFRALFGVLLIASILAIIVGTIAAIASIFNSDSGGDGIDLSGAGDGLFDLAGSFDGCHIHFPELTYDFLRLLDWTYYWSDPCGYYRPYGYSYDYYYSGADAKLTPVERSSSSGSEEKKEQGDFVTNCFSFLFGDGHPNADLKDRYWQQIGLVIKRHHGVVIAEQLAPFGGDESGTEDWMLPILVHFNGSPEVTDKGNIIYVFPAFVSQNNISSNPLSIKETSNNGGSDALRDLYNSHLKRKATQTFQGITNPYSQLSRFLEERRWQFTLQSADSAMKIGILTLVNFGGSFWLYNASMHLKVLRPMHHVSLYMLYYSIFLLAIPTLRWLIITILNARIDVRNELRTKFANQLSTPTEIVREKINEASVHTNTLLLAPAPSIVFTTEEDSLAQQFSETPKFERSRNFVANQQDTFIKFR